MKHKVPIKNNITHDDVKKSIQKLRGTYDNTIRENKNDLNVRDMLKITRNLNEQEKDDEVENKKTIYDQEQEEEKFLNYVDGLKVNPKFIDLVVTNDYVLWGGIVDGIIKFIYMVTPNESTSGVEFQYTEDFSPDNPENNEIIKKIETYYDEFYNYWTNNMIEN
ncbi:MAG: hypothetical protein ACOC2W_03140 [bacterium]